MAVTKVPRDVMTQSEGMAENFLDGVGTFKEGSTVSRTCLFEAGSFGFFPKKYKPRKRPSKNIRKPKVNDGLFPFRYVY